MADFPISPVVRRVVYTGSAGTGPYAFTFEILAQTDIDVYVDATLKTLTTDYTVTINSNGTGAVNFVTAPGSTKRITIVGARDITRASDYVTGGDFTAASLNVELDQQTIFNQQNAEALGRAILAPVTDPDSINMVLPVQTSRAGKTLAFDSNGNPVVGEDIGNYRGNWTVGLALVVRDLVKDTTTQNIFRVNTAHTSSGALPLTTNADSAKFDLVVDAASAASSATAAASSASAAASSASAASTSASNASTSATNAASSASAASTSASNASTSATNAANSATSASGSASTATSQATAATTSATNAATSASAASGSASTASTQATNASNSASAASTSETNAASSASAASTSASNASTSATNASNSASTATTQATNAATSATGSANSATSAAASAASAAALLDNFDDRYLGAKASDPALDNDGNALVTGALYFNTTDGVMKVYTASGWIAASSASVATLATFEFVATSGQTVFTGADANSATLSYVAPALIVTLNGVRLRPGDDYTATNGTSITLVSAAALNDELVVDAFGSFLVANTYTIAQTDAGFVAKTSATGAANLPSGTTGERPGSPSAGQTRFNSTIGFAEYYTGTQWVNYGNISTPSITYLLVAGGGGGGGAGSANSAAGGGGAGGLLASTTSVSAGTSYSITIGAGGSGGTASNDNFSATSGGNTTAFSLTAVGGGSAPNSNNQSNTSPRNGGSGAGGTGNPSSSTGYPGTGTAGQGNAGGTSQYNSNYPGGGGGGAGAAGGNATPTVAANGGVGVSNSITGTAVFYAGGGGGGIYNSASFSSGGNGGGGAGGGNATTPGTAGTANTGGGGGGTGGSASGGSNQAGGNGGSGVCIISYSASYKDATATGTYTKTEASGNTIYTFTGSGTITF
jgi:hypothetical protein